MVIRDVLAAYIRAVDGDNRMPIEELAERVSVWYGSPDGLVDFVCRVNRDKTMGAAALADAVVDEFDAEPWT